MSYKHLSIVAGAALALCAGTLHAATVNGFANGGFETAGTTTAASAWLAGAAGYSLSSDAHSGSFSALLASPAFNAAVMLQNSKEQGGLPNLTVGDTPTLSFWAKGYAGGTGNVLFALRFLDDIGNIKYSSGNVFFQGQINTTTWSQITFTAGAVPAGATAAFIEFSQGIGPIDAGNLAGAVRIDDLYLGVAAAVPEPGSYALMLAGLGAVGVMVRRRQKAI
jgi:PEP-CTERM motif